MQRSITENIDFYKIIQYNVERINEGGTNMAKKNEEVKTVVWVFWILLAIIGVSMLFAGIQGS